MYQTSKYNYFVPYKGKMLYFNSLRRSSFAMTMAEHQKIRKLFEDPISFSLEYPSVFAQFYQWGFFVDAYHDELAVFRHLYNRDIVFSGDYHLVLMNTPGQEFSTVQVQTLAKHVNQTLKAKEVKSICIEWRGHNVISTFESFINPLYIKTKKLCKESGVELTGQIEVKLSNNEVIHNKMYHNKGVPTFDQTIRDIRHIIRLNPEFRLRLNVNAFPFDTATRKTFMKQFDEIALKKIHWVWSPHEKQKKEKEQKSESDYYSNLFDERYSEINPEQTSAFKAPRKNAAVIYPDMKVFMSVPHELPQETQSEGTLNETDGSIQWNEAEREKRLSRLWYEWKNCAACPYLPLLFEVCPILNLKNVQVCPVENKMIDPETLIIKEFESKSK